MSILLTHFLIELKYVASTYILLHFIEKMEYHNNRPLLATDPIFDATSIDCSSIPHFHIQSMINLIGTVVHHDHGVS